jgi:hypothetical protein
VSIKRNFVLVLTTCAAVLFCQPIGQPQSTTASVTGRVLDPSNAAIPNATVTVLDVDTQIIHKAISSDDGLFTVSGLLPGNYRIEVAKPGFKTVIKPDVVLHVQDVVAINFKMILGSVAESVTVEGGAPLVNMQDASVSTVVDRNFAENLPMNGRSFQTLIQLTPGVVLTPTNSNDLGQFSVNGQRAVSNYWMVDGVSANIGIGGVNAMNGLGGALGSFSAQGGTNSLVSVDALQEFRIQTSTYAPEFGRTPGGQISIVTRSGTNLFHGSVFDYLRNDVFDANDWFANRAKLAKPRERQNDFGGTFSGPIFKDRTFFFFSYEGLRLRLPQVALTNVPCDGSCAVFGNARAMAVPAMQPYFNAFPLPNGPEVFTSCTPNVNGCPASGQQPTGAAQFNASFSNSSTLDATSIRVDHKLSGKMTIWGRYNFSPSSIVVRGFPVSPLNTISPNGVTTQTATVGSTWTISSGMANDLRFNYSRTNSDSFARQDSFGGAVPLTSLPTLPSPFTTQDSLFTLAIFPLSKNGYYILYDGKLGHNLQRQVNVVEGLIVQKGSHSLKFGVDLRRLSPSFDIWPYSQQVYFLDVPSAQKGNGFLAQTLTGRPATFLFHNLGMFAQDTWRAAPRLTLTYGLRWDIDFTPSSVNGPNLLAVTGFNPSDMSQLAPAPDGTQLFKTTYGNVAPRVGVAYQLGRSPDSQTVLRGGFGVFYDLATSEAGALVSPYYYPFGGSNTFCCSNFAFPLDSTTAAPPKITTPSSGVAGVTDPNLKLPYTLEWNVAIQQSLGREQVITASYVGSTGRRLLQTGSLRRPNPNWLAVNITSNAGTSYYSALQLQFQRRLSHDFQVLASYTWSHSIDTGSAGSNAVLSNALVWANQYSNRGSSDFDIRHSFSVGITYNVPAPRLNSFTNKILYGWSLQSVLQARSAPPVDITDQNFSQFNPGVYATVRPDVVSGQPLYLHGPQYAGGKAFNPAAFTEPPIDGNTGNPLRQGTVPRNFLRGFGATQWDFAVHRNFPIHESLRLEFRAEMFNVLNHPNFGPPDAVFPDPTFGEATQMLGRSLAGGLAGGGSLSPLYQIGGPRSIQLALKLFF